MTIEDLNNIPIKFANGATVFVRDVGQVRDAWAVQQISFTKTANSGRASWRPPLPIKASADVPIGPICLSGVGKLFRDDRRVVGQRRREQPKKEQHDREVHQELQERKAHDVARLQPEDTKER